MRNQVLGMLLVVGLVLAGCSRPMGPRVASSLPVTNSVPIDLNGVLARAKAENKVVLLDFTGSDWCPPCKMLHRTVLSKPEFQAYADSNLIFLTVDFPSHFRLPPEATATNDLLAQKFDVKGFPTLIALKGDGTQVLKKLGFAGGSPKGLIETLEEAKSKTR